MKTRYVKYGKTVRRTDGTTEHAEINVELEPNEYEEEAFAKVKKIVRAQLVEEPLRATIADMVRSKNDVQQ